MSSKTKQVLSKHNLHVLVGLLNQKQVEQSVAAFLAQLRTHFKSEPDYMKATYEVNVVTDTKGNSFNFAYVWLSSAKACNILCGLNADGSERADYIPDPNWVAPVAPRKAYVPPAGKMSWADMVEEEEEIEKTYTHPLIKVKKGPLMTLPLVAYSPEQKKIAAEQLLTKAREEGKDPDTIKVPNEGAFVINRSFINPTEEDYDPVVLCCRTAPTWVTEEIIAPYFTKFSTDVTLTQIKNKGKNECVKFPLVRVHPNPARPQQEYGARGPFNCIFVTFSRRQEHVNDGAFCLQMRRKFTVTQGDKSAQLIFSFWYKKREYQTRK